MSSAILYVAIVAIWAGVLIPRWLRRDSSASSSSEQAGDDLTMAEPDSDDLTMAEPDSDDLTMAEPDSDDLTMAEPDSAADEEPAPRSRPEMAPAARATARTSERPEAPPEVRLEARAERRREARAERRLEARAERRPEARAERRPEARAERRPEARAERRPEARAERRPEARAERRSEARAERRPEARAERRPEMPEARREAPPRGEFFGSERDQEDKRVRAARQRLLGLLLVLVIGSGTLAFTKLAAWWVVVPPSVMLLGYMALLREAAKADTERRELARTSAVRARSSAALPNAASPIAGPAPARAPAPDAEVIDISASFGPAGEVFYDQYADAKLRAVGDLARALAG